MYPRLLSRARSVAAGGFATATIELPGSGDRDPLPDVDHARTKLRTALTTGEPVTEDIIDSLVLPLVDKAVPELRATIDALLSLPELDGPVGYSGGVTAIGVRLALVEPRIAALGLFGQLPNPSHVARGPPGRRAGARLVAVGRCLERPATSPRTVRRPRLSREDPAGEHGRPQRTPARTPAGSSPGI